jgi:four helix bundle protein
MDRSEDWLNFKIDLRNKLRAFVLEVVQVVSSLPNTTPARVLGYQLMKSGTSAYANYRAALRAKSKAEFYNKISLVVEETDASESFLDLLIESGILKNEKVNLLHKDSQELIKILASLRKSITVN